MNQDGIRQVIFDCVENCRKQADPIAQVQPFLAGLRSAGWHEDDIQYVETIVLRTLRGIAGIPDVQEHDRGPENP